MTETTPTKYIIGIIVFTMVVISGVIMLSSLKADNPSILSDKLTSFNDTFNVYNDITSEVNTLESNVTDAKVDITGLGAIGGLIESAWNQIRLLTTSLSFMKNVFNGFNTILGVPREITVLLSLIIVVIIIFTIYSLIFQGRT